MVEPAPRVVGDRRLPCHGTRAARLVPGGGAVVRSCPVCRARYSIRFVGEPEVSRRVGMPVVRVEISPWIDGRTRRRVERASAREASLPRLPLALPGDPFGTAPGGRAGQGVAGEP